VRPEASLAAAQASLKEENLTCEALVDTFLQRIAQHEHLNAFVEVYEEEARQRARAIDQKLAAGTAGPLAGLVLGVKDTIVQAQHGTEASSRILRGFQSLFSATALSRALAADAIVIGRMNCDEFAMGSSNENSALGPVRNPVATDHVPGGSSGGSAAAVRAQLCHASLGSDTGGSIRQPAALTGTVGLKPTYGRVSRYGLIAYGSSFDQIGPITNTVEDAAKIMAVIAGEDRMDNTSSDEPVQHYPAYLQGAAKEGPYKIGILRDTLDREGLDPQVREHVTQVAKQLQAQGHEIRELSFPLLDYLVPTYYILSTAEASSNLARYDGVRYGYRSDNATNPSELFYATRTEGFGPEVKRRIMLGTFVLSAGYHDAYYTQAMRVRRKIQAATNELLAEVDFLLSPTTPTPAFELGAKTQDPIAMYLSDIFTVQANLAGHPAISLPTGLHANGLPIGTQLTAGFFEEAKLLQFSHQLTQSTTNS
jgi:aspartyl-tRNA(Asn)/glutamyl-tRNA(Gln) amidotransferase subunit A